MKRLLILLAVLLSFAITAKAQEPRSYTEGAISVVTSVKIMDGQFDNYMNYLGQTYKSVMEAQKKAGIILDYAIYDASPRTPEDADLYLVVVYPNMASFDGLADKTEPLMTKVTGLNRAAASSASADRGKMRTILGSEIVRELKLK